jgi:hypothetical protein
VNSFNIYYSRRGGRNSCNCPRYSKKSSNLREFLCKKSAGDVMDMRLVQKMMSESNTKYLKEKEESQGEDCKDHKHILEVVDTLSIKIISETTMLELDWEKFDDKFGKNSVNTNLDVEMLRTIAAPSLAPSSLPTALPSNAPSLEKYSAPTATPSSLPSITASSSGPSAVASVGPSKPSPSTSPSLQVDGVQCADNDEYRVEKKNGELKPCSWLTKNKFRNTRFCGRKAVRENCPKSCLTCDNDDYLVLRINGFQNRCSWLNGKEKRRKKYCNQEEIIKNCPISCQCANDYMFNFRGGVNCSWLAGGNNDGSQRRKLFCPQRSANRSIREACPLACEESNCSF